MRVRALVSVEHIVISRPSEIFARAQFAHIALMTPGTVTESVERRPCVQEVDSFVPGRVKLMTYKVYGCRFLTRRLALI